MEDSLVLNFSKTLNIFKNQRIWNKIQAYMMSRQELHFVTSALGGTFRGKHWDYFKPMYVRKDGTIVPIWGGVPKVRGKGLVLGKIRSKTPGSKKRYQKGDHLMQNTGILKNALLQNIIIKGNLVRLITPVKYAGYQNSLRNFNYFAPDEAQYILNIFAQEFKNGKI